jgi:hypothetical protein
MNSFIITKLDSTTFDLYDKTIPSTIVSGSQNCQLLSEDTLTIQTKSAQPLPLSIGDKCTIYGKKYKINTPPTVKKQGPRKFITDIIFEGIQYELLDAQFLLPDGTIGDSFTGNLYDFLKILIGNANRVGNWTIGDFPNNTEYKTLTFNAENCLSVLQRLCEEYGQEFEIEQSDVTNILHIGNVGADFPYTFKYGRTGGLYELTRKSISSENIVTKLYAYGGSKNLGNGYLSTRGYNKLCLPDKNKNSSYIQDTTVINNYGLKENRIFVDSVFPNRYGTVTALDEDYLSFIDSTMFDLNEMEDNGNDTKWLIAGVAAKVHFNTGKLAGYDFDVKSYDHTLKKIKLIQFEDESGMKLPDVDNAAFQISVGDEYFFIDIRLPKAYIDEAEAKLQAEAELYYAQNSQPRVQYELNIYDIFLKQFAGPDTISNLFAVGDYVPVEDADIGVNKSIRITGFTRDIMKPYKYNITLGEAVTKTTITRLIKDQRSVEEIIRFNNLNDPSRARRNWRASQEVLSMVFDTEGDYYSDKIKPLSIETNMLQVGAKSMQFILSNVIFEPNYQGDPNVIKVGGGQLIHYTIEDTIRTWSIASTIVSNLISNTAYYIYVRCSKQEDAGNIIIDTTQRKVDYEDGYYTFMIGVLNSVETDSDGSNPGRLVSLTYGSTTINGRFIKTGRIESSGGSGSYFDLDENKFRIGNNQQGLSWNENNNGQLILKGTLVQGQTGDTQPIGFFRGIYNPAYVYYNGDMVTYQGSTYRYIYDTPTSGNLPTNTTYWTIYTEKGDPGANGEASDWKTFAYKKSATKPQKPTDTIPIPNGWKDYPDSEATGDDKWWMVVSIVHWTGTEWKAGTFINNVFTPGQWSEPITVTGEQGTDGQYIDFKFYATSNMNAPSWNSTLASMLNPTGWLDQPPQLPVSGAIWMIEAWKQTGGTQLITTWSTPVRISGEKGTNGQDGAYFEYRYAKNGSTTTPPTLSVASAIPSGWSTTVPNIGTLEYLWVTITKKSASGTLLQNWSTPVRTSGSDGKDGSNGKDGNVGPSIVFRGVYSSSATYYGTKTRVDVVKYNNTYYVARTDAGNGFSGQVPTNTSYWNTFGAQFESVATGLLLAELAYIENLMVGRLSSGKDDTLPRLTAKGSEIGFYLNKSAESSASNALIRIGLDVGSKQTGSVDNAGIILKTKGSGARLSELTSAGLYVDGGRTVMEVPDIPLISGGFSIVALLKDRGTPPPSRTIVSSAILGWDQTETNYNNPNNITTLGFGGYFNKLYTAGLYCSCRRLTQSDSEANRVIQENDTFISMNNTSATTIFLPLPQTAGKIIFVRVNNATVTINAYIYSFSKHIMLPSGSIVDANDARTRGELVTLFWDGSYWLWSTTA